MSKLTLIIPAKNEQSVIGDVVARAVAQEIVRLVIVVDDGSSDKTGAIAREAGATVIRHPYSMGNGAAIKTGARAASTEWIAFMDGDGQHDPEYLPGLFEYANERGYEMVVASRARSSQASLPRQLANGFYNYLASVLTEQKVMDLTSGFRVVKRDLFMEFVPLLPNKFSYPTTITMAFFRAGYAVGYRTTSVAQRVGKSHINPLSDGFRFLLIIFKLATLYSPLKVFIPVSLLLFSGGLGYAGFTLIAMGRFTNMSALLLSVAVIIFFIGLISEQITNLMYMAAEKNKD